MDLAIAHFAWPKNLAGESIAPSPELAKEMRRRLLDCLTPSKGNVVPGQGNLIGDTLDNVLRLLKLLFDGTAIRARAGGLVPASNVADRLQVIKVKNALVVLVFLIANSGISGTEDFPNRLPVLT